MIALKNLLFICIFLSVSVGCSAKRDLVVPSPEHQDSVVASRASRDLIVLLPDPDGKVGTLQVTTDGATQTLDKPGFGLQVEKSSEPPTASGMLDKMEISRIFGPALSNQPDLTGRFISFILYFERDTTYLTPESKKLLPQVVRTIRNRKSNEVFVTGHTDRVGLDAYNTELSSRRADRVRDLLVSAGIQSSALVVSFHGESMPLVYTDDEVAEPRNRRVEVMAR